MSEKVCVKKHTKERLRVGGQYPVGIRPWQQVADAAIAKKKRFIKESGAKKDGAVTLFYHTQ